MAIDYDELAQTIIDNVGGPENVIALTHCVTRLRFRLRDESLVNDNTLTKTKGVIHVLHVPGQVHVVVGQVVDVVYDAIVASGAITAGGEVPVEAADVAEEFEESAGILGTLIDLVSAIVAPTLGAMAAAGIIKGVLSMCRTMGWLAANDGAYMMLYAIGDGFFYFLPIILGYTSARKFKMDIFVGMVIGAAFTYPTMVAMTSTDVLGTIFGGTPFEMSYYSTFFGIPIIYPAAGYTSSVFPIIVSCWVASKVEKFLRPKLPDFLRFFAAPLVTLLVAVPLGYLIIGPVMTLFTCAIQALFNLIAGIGGEGSIIGGTIAGVFVGAVWQILVIFGFHWALIPIKLANIGSLGFDQMIEANWVCSFAQTAVCLAILLKTKNKNLRDTALPAVFTGFFGVTEPAIYGVTLPRVRYFVISCIGSAIGGGIVGAAGVKSFMSGGLALFALPQFVPTAEILAANPAIYPDPWYGVRWICIGMAVAVVLSFVLTMMIYRDEGADAK